MADHDQSVSPVSLVGSLDTSVLPVSPVQIVPQQAEPEWMRKIFVRHHFSVRAVQPSHLYPVQLGVTPVQRLVLAVQSQSVRPTEKIFTITRREGEGEFLPDQLGVDDNFSVSSVHPGPLDPRLLAPV